MGSLDPFSGRSQSGNSTLHCEPAAPPIMTRPRPDLTQNYGKLAASYDAHRYEGVEAEFRLERTLDVVKNAVGSKPGMRILDVGVGTGKGALTLAEGGASVVGLDFTTEMLQIAKRKATDAERENVKFTRGNAAHLPFESGTFDVVVSLNFLHLFVPVDRERVFTKEMHRVLRPGGVLVIELVNLYQALFLGLYRKRFGPDLGFNSPADVERLLSPEFEVTEMRGGQFPGAWRLLHPLSRVSPGLARRVAGLADRSPWKFIAYNLFIQAVRK